MLQDIGMAEMQVGREVNLVHLIPSFAYLLWTSFRKPMLTIVLVQMPEGTKSFRVQKWRGQANSKATEKAMQRQVTKVPS